MCFLVVEHARTMYPSIPVTLATVTGVTVSVEWRVNHRVKLLSKPFGPEALVATVRRLLEHA